MKDFTKYQGIIPAFYACYDAEGNISPEGVRALTRYHIEQGVKGVYVPLKDRQIPPVFPFVPLCRCDPQTC